MTMKLNQRTDDTAPEPKKLQRYVVGKFSGKLPPSLLLFRARELLGVSRQQMAEQMGIPRTMLRKFEFGELRMPTSFLIKIFMFGLDFWADGIHWKITDEDPHAGATKKKLAKMAKRAAADSAPAATPTTPGDAQCAH